VTSPAPSVVVSRSETMLVLRIARPQVLNALNRDVVEHMDAGLDAAAAEPSIRSVVITGTGRAFCAGADLTLFTGSDPAEGRRFRYALGALLERIEAFQTPVIAAVNGIAVAGGLELVLACDLVIASRDAHLGDGHSVHGLIPGAGASVRLPRVIGPRRAAEMLYTGATYDAELLQSWGLINQVVCSEELDSTVAALGARLSRRSPLGLRRMKHLLHASADLPSTEALQAERSCVDRHDLSPDVQEGVAAFLTKRPPVFASTSESQHHV
jgi:enoyl-CoA hydratase